MNEVLVADGIEQPAFGEMGYINATIGTIASYQSIFFSLTVPRWFVDVESDESYLTCKEHGVRVEMMLLRTILYDWRCYFPTSCSLHVK